MSWLLPADARAGLGCMRLSTSPDRDEARARATVHAALDAGFTLFDTAHAYGRDETEYGHNEKWMARFLAEHAKGAGARVITKGGMRRAGPKWIPDGKATTLRAQCEASLVALGGRAIDLYLLHAPDPRVPLATSVRALEALRAEGLVKAVGICNVNRAQLEEAMEHAEISAVQLGVSLVDDSALAGGVVARAVERGVTVICHSPLGGPRKFAELSRQRWLAERAQVDGCTLHEWALAALMAIDPNVVVIPGARRPETVASCRRAVDVKLPDEAAMVLRRFVRPLTPPPQTPLPQGEGAPEIVLLMGLQGSGKTSRVSESVARGYSRLNRDEAGGTLAQLHDKLGLLLRSGVQRAVLDNTYVTRQQRRGAIEVATRSGIPVRGVWHEIDVAQAQINVVLRMLEVHGRLLGPAELKGRTPDTIGPMVIPRTVKTLEVPADDEGFSSLTRVPFVRRPWPDGVPALFLGLDQLKNGAWLPEAAAAMAQRPAAVRVLLGWSEGGVSAPDGFVNAVCPHGGGPPSCWCRPPLPGLVLAHARSFGICLSKSRVVSGSPSLLSLSASLGMQG
ncbi:MAG: aldo/keto reductase [Archangium sp.]|nr:aldo/keto reductase [Archangium sp.]MDP3574347.1 aldo/keto reductase [Archangium sp.]